MLDQEKVALVGTLINDNSISSEVVETYLALAKDRIKERCYPFVDFTAEASEGVEKYPMPKKYEKLQCELASRMILRRGTEGQTAHNENGINRAYGSVDDSDILGRVSQILV